ncbi:response regulator transcription factor [Enterococcus quebecensis]|uniref:DNA-binding response regulator n=1 Tax=Enterococcus quebecensis TaxID=903983 RepID=A0A1E5GR51_9ENTE|nr:response regulator transcription factor [Enterococcus quebecensis]OEG15183.1 DNA-binding response regulator [Enterococcus quebecensis]OJG74760.1 response regulator [Enterococcus quebecensis]
MKTKILVVEDDTMTNQVITDFLEEKGYEVLSALDGEEAWQIIEEEELNLILLDIMLPTISGLELLERIRKTSDVPIIMLTAIDQEHTQLISFKQKVDDYVIKPFSPTILVKRVEAVLRRSEQVSEVEKQEVHHGDVRINFDSSMIFFKDDRIPLTKIEYRIVEYLAKNKGRVVTREQLIETIWGYEFTANDRVIDSHMKNIRKKIPSLRIETIKGIGYMLEAEK